MKEKVLEALHNLGFKPEYTENVGYTFSYENISLLYMYNDNDGDFLNIAVPGILEYEEEDTLQFCALMEKINSTLKYIKAYILGGSMWLFYERELFENDDLEEIISHMILHLEGGLFFARKAMLELEGEKDETAVEEATDDSVEEEDNDNE